MNRSYWRSNLHMDKLLQWSPIVLALAFSIQVSAECPRACVCTSSSNLLQLTCNHQHLTETPSNLPNTTEYLDLSHNSITSLHEGLASLHNLTFLNFSYNQLSYLNASIFYHLSSLQVLEFHYNKILDIQPQFFTSLSLLETLHLENNNLSFLDNETFSGLWQLKILNISSNQVREIKNETFQDFGTLLVLDLSSNGLCDTHAFTFTGLANLQELYLQNNCIHYLDANTFSQLPQLEFLDLSHNKLNIVIRHALSGMPNLQSLSMRANVIESLSPLFMGTSDHLEVLNLDENNITNISIPIFQGLDKLKQLSLNKMPFLNDIAFNAFHGLPGLMSINMRHNPRLSLIHPNLFDQLANLTSVDVSFNNLSSLSQLTFRNNTRLNVANLTGNHFQCDCRIVWLAKTLQSNSTVFNHDLQCLTGQSNIPVYLVEAQNLSHTCRDIPGMNTTQIVYFPIASQARLVCPLKLDQHSVLVWITPNQGKLTYHAFHPAATAHLWGEDDVLLNSSYHTSHFWHNSSNYQAHLISFSDRVMLLNDGSLYIDYVLRSDNGPYKCKVMNGKSNASAIIFVNFDYSILFNVKIMSIAVGLTSAISFFLLNIIFSAIGVLARRLVNQRRREAIHRLLENLDTYKRAQFAKLRENYSSQLNRIRDQYHHQFNRLSDNYHLQTKRVREGCVHQVDRIRDNYTFQVNRLRNYSSHQIEQIRERYNHQLLKMRDYGSLQLIRFHEKYKLKQQHVIKILETMNLDNCRTVIETECLRTESMIFDVDLLQSGEESPPSTLSVSDSEYITASSLEGSSQESLELSQPIDNQCPAVELCGNTEVHHLHQSLPPSDDMEQVFDETPVVVHLPNNSHDVSESVL